MIWIIALAWIISGVLGYVVMRERFLSVMRRYSKGDRLMNLFMILAGPIHLGEALLVHVIGHGEYWGEDAKW